VITYIYICVCIHTYVYAYILVRAEHLRESNFGLTRDKGGHKGDFVNLYIYVYTYIYMCIYRYILVGAVRRMKSSSMGVSDEVESLATPEEGCVGRKQR